MRSLATSDLAEKMKLKLLAVFAFMLLFSCNTDNKHTLKISGNAQGTTWQITWMSGNNNTYKEAIDSIFKTIDASLSTYVPGSLISRINNNDPTVLVDDHFTNVFNQATEVSEKTGGLFDITVAPLINAWGFGFTKKAKVDSAMIDSLLTIVGYKMVKLEGRKLVKAKPGCMLDVNAIAQGYTVDVLANFLGSKGINNYLVELGGEVFAKGKKQNGNDWRIGIDQPNEIPAGGRLLKAKIKLRDRALATSGNYRKFYMEEGKKYAHIIDPRTGYPAKNNLLSATVLAPDCMTADAYATAFMVMGLERSKQFLGEHPELGLEVYFIYDENGEWKTYSSETLKALIEEMP